VTNAIDIQTEICGKFGDAVLDVQETRDKIPTLRVTAASVHDVVLYLNKQTERPYRTLYDLSAIDERSRNGPDMPHGAFTVVYHLLSYERNHDVRIKVPLDEDCPTVPTVTDIWPAANWYEREVWDMFGITFSGHPHLTRILLPPTWKGHPLRKDHPSRATEMPPFELTGAREEEELDALRFDPEAWGMKRASEGSDFVFLNLGPHHPGTHGLLRMALQLDGEKIIDAVPDIGFHHRGAEKMAERQTWHTFLPYTDRIDYLAGTMNNLAYVLAVEKLAGIEAPPRAQVIRVMLAEIFRIASHLVFYGTLAGDLGAMSPVFYMFTDREHALGVIEAICGARMHPNWLRIGGVAQDLPRGWDAIVSDFLKWLPHRLFDYDTMVMNNPIFKKRTKNIGAFTAEEAVEWGVTGPGLRACGSSWDLRKMRPYSGYDQFEFDVPTASNGDCYDRAVIHVEEMRQSMRIVEQCVRNMPQGPYKSDHALATPPVKERTMQDIETLITHFLSVSWGPVIPKGEAHVAVEAAKGINGYYLISDGGNSSYRTRIRTPSFAHLQMVPLMSRGASISDLIAILGSLDFVLADVDR
jgi:NADH-quinone oxidoreductase subunit C/D